MLSTLSGIHELVNVMRNEVSEYLHSDMSTPSGVRGVYTLHCEAFGTPIASSVSATGSSSLQPGVILFHPAEPEFVTAGLHHQLPSSNSTINPPRDCQQQQPVYTLLTSRTSKFTPVRPELGAARTHELSNTMDSPSGTQPPKPVHTVLAPRTSKFTPLIPKPDLVPAGLNKTSKLTIYSPSCNPTKVQKILPKPVYTVLTLNNNFCHARPKPNTSLLYQLLQPNVASTTCASTTSETKLTFSNPIPAVPTSNVSSCVIARDDNILHVLPKFTFSNSGLNPHLKSNTTSSTDSTNSEMKQTSLKPVHIVQSIETRSNRIKNSRQTRSMSATKPNKKPTNRVPRKPAARQVKACVPECKATCDGSLNDVKVALEREALWKMFHDEGNEMMVSRDGRPMFPMLELNVSGLVPQEMYKVAVNFVFVDNYRYNFYSSLGVWNQKIENRHEPESEHSRCFEAPESPECGQFWNGKLLTFKELRLTNHPTEAKNMVYVPTMRKQRVQLVVTILRCARCHAKHTRHIDIPLTEFIPVSSYYNTKITEMKIANNPQAKMRYFRSHGKRKRTTRGCKSPKEVTSCQSDDSCPGSTISESDTPHTALLATPIKSSESNHVTMLLNNETLSTTTNTQLTNDLNTTSTLTSASSVLLSLSTIPPFIPQSTLPSTSSSQFPSISRRATTISSTSGMKPIPYVSSSTTTYPSGLCNIVYTCQTTKPTAHVQTDDDILNFIKIYLSPFQAKNEDYDSSIFDELEENLNYLSEKLDNFDYFKKLQHLPLC